LKLQYTPERTMNSMGPLFKSQFNLDLALPEHILWIVYQFARESKAYEEAHIIEMVLIQITLLFTDIRKNIKKKILKINPRLKEIRYCCSIATHEDEDEHYTRDMFADEIIRVPKYPLLRIWSKIDSDDQLCIDEMLDILNNGNNHKFIKMMIIKKRLLM
jgi:hypothetical protein